MHNESMKQDFSKPNVKGVFQDFFHIPIILNGSTNIGHSQEEEYHNRTLSTNDNALLGFCF